ncbi:hypothetical protein [Paenibacillus agilis]|uniref:UDP-glucuronosyltransferase n=1 Tax=Paenibacillus agilis TaxID=3020863 RepID=A0A559J1V6_9BACL|nr:hypothetical protein [Paenibacillus agilis]TVX93859.1 hypothetical protein FPZ44_12825 [Paenibacillus agilis]
MSAFVTVLSAANSLGIYVPAKLLQHQLRSQGLQVQIEMLEQLYPAVTRDSIPRYRKAFHQSFRVAKTGYHLAKNLGDTLETVKVEALLTKWKDEGRKHFIVMTGFWIPVIERYKEIMGDTLLTIQLIRLDAGESASYAVHKGLGDTYRNVWMFEGNEQQQLYRQLLVSKEAPLPFESRADRYTIHGGGWGIGTYQNIIDPARQQQLALNVIAYYVDDIPDNRDLHRYYMIDPAWNPWDINEHGEHGFPPFAEVDEQGNAAFQTSSGRSYPEVFDLIRNSRAVISKPGGATLVDSLSAATPIIMLEPFGSHEVANMKLWESAGFGIRYELWKEAGFSNDLLREMHDNLMRAREKAIDVVEELVAHLQVPIN